MTAAAATPKPAVCKNCRDKGSNADRRTCSLCTRLCCRHLSVPVKGDGFVSATTVVICGPCNLRKRRTPPKVAP